MKTLPDLITAATLRGATIHITHDGDAISTVQALGLTGMTEWPLPASWAARELGIALTRGAA